MDRHNKRDIPCRLARLTYIVFGMVNRLGLCLTRKYMVSISQRLKRNLLRHTAGLLWIITEMA